MGFHPWARRHLPDRQTHLVHGRRGETARPGSSRPGTAAGSHGPVCCSFSRTSPAAFNDTVYRGFSVAVGSYSKQAFSPQQIRFLLSYFLFLLSLVSPAASFKHLGGPPGSGKTVTVTNAAFVWRDTVIVETVLRRLVEAGLPGVEDTHDIAIRITQLRIAYIATTNDAVDAGVNAAQQVVDSTRPAYSQPLLLPTRVSALSKAIRRGNGSRWQVDVHQARLLHAKYANEMVTLAERSEKATKAGEALNEAFGPVKKEIKAGCSNCAGQVNQQPCKPAEWVSHSQGPFRAH